MTVYVTSMFPGYERGYKGVCRNCLAGVASNVGSNSGIICIAEKKQENQFLAFLASLTRTGLLNYRY